MHVVTSQFSFFRWHGQPALSSEVSQTSKSVFFCAKLTPFQNSEVIKTHNNQFKTHCSWTWDWHPPRPWSPTKILSSRERGQTTTKTIQLWQDHLCGLPLGQMPDWAWMSRLNSLVTWQGLVQDRPLSATLATCPDYKIQALWASPAVDSPADNTRVCCNWFVFVCFLSSLFVRCWTIGGFISKPSPQSEFWIDWTCVFWWSHWSDVVSFRRKYLDFDVWPTSKDRAAGQS